jgi:hypothetical protein
MQIFDCNLSYGRHSSGGPYMPCNTISLLRGELERAGISGGLVRHDAADLAGAVTGNRLLYGDIGGAGGELWGVYTLLPSCTGEVPGPAELPGVLAGQGMRAVRFNPEKHRYLPQPQVIGDYLEVLAEKKIPVHFHTGCGITLEQVHELMLCFPDLTAILTYANCWPSDRLLRPFLDNFPNLCLDTTYLLTDMGFEAIVERYGAGRLLFGSGFPDCYLGAHMLTLRHSEISDGDKAAILGGNLMRLIKGVSPV